MVFFLSELRRLEGSPKRAETRRIEARWRGNLEMGKLSRCWVLLLTSLLFELEDKEEKLKKPFGRAEFRRTSIDGERDNPF